MNYLSQFLKTYQGLPRSVYIIFLSRFVTTLGSFVGPLLTLIMTDKIGMSANEVGRLVSFSSIFTAVVFMYGGHLADKVGRKKIIMLGSGLGALCIAICAFLTPSYVQAMILILSGICFSLGGPASNALLADLSTPENRKVVYSLSYMGVNLGLAFGAALSGFLYAYSLPLLFTLDALTTILSLLLLWFFVEEPDFKTKTEHQVVEVSQKNESTLSLFKTRKHLLIFAVVMIGIDFTYAQLNFLLPLHVSTVFGADTGAQYFGLLSSCNAIVVILLTPLLTPLLKNIPTMIAITVGAVFYVIGFGMPGFFETFGFFMVAVVISTIGEIILTLNIPTYIMNQTPATHRGRMSAVLDFIMGIGYGIAPWIVGQWLNLVSPQQAWHFISIVTITCTLILGCLTIWQRKKGHENEVLIKS